MKEIQEITNNINKAVERYNDLPLFDTHALIEVMKDLSSNLFYLEKHRIKAHEDFNSYYYNSKASSNAAKNKEAEIKCPELYMLRRVIDSGYKVLDAVRSQISVSKMEQ